MMRLLNLLLAAALLAAPALGFVAPTPSRGVARAAASVSTSSRQARTVVHMGGKTSKFGIFSPAVYAAKAAIGEKELNKVRAKAITLHSQGKTRHPILSSRISQWPRATPPPPHSDPLSPPRSDQDLLQLGRHAAADEQPHHQARQDQRRHARLPRIGLPLLDLRTRTHFSFKAWNHDCLYLANCPMHLMQPRAYGVGTKTHAWLASHFEIALGDAGALGGRRAHRLVLIRL